MSAYGPPDAPVIPLRAEPELEPARIDNGDGTYTLAPPPGLRIGDVSVESIFTWTYGGQQRFAWDPEPLVRGESVVEAPTADTDAESLLGTARIDSYGSRWEITAVDADGLAEMLAAEDAVSPEVLDGDAVVGPAATADDDLPVGAIDEVEFQSWATIVCPSYDVHLWDGDSRTLVSPPSNQTKAAVSVSSALGLCTGTILRERFVLTAAHCVTDLVTHGPVQAQTVNVARVDVTDAESGVELFIDDDWLNGSDEVNDDYALIRVSGFTAGFTEMDISAASDATIQALLAPHNVAVQPAHVGGLLCTVPGYHSVYHNSADPLGTVYTNKLNLKLDGTFGHSGGPVYYCPDGDDDLCLPGEKGFVLAVWSAWDLALTTFRGPKGPAFRAWATALMNTN